MTSARSLDDEIEGRPITWPTRWPIVAGTMAIVPGAYMPWQTVSYPAGPPQTFNGIAGADAPGLQLILFAGATLLLGALRSVAGSRTRTVQWLPAVAGALTFLYGLQEYTSLAPRALWTPARPLTNVLEPGLWMSFGGSALVAIGGVATSISIARSRGLRREVVDGRPDFSFVPSLVAAIAGLALAVAGMESLQGWASPLSVLGAVAVAIGIDRLLRRTLGDRVRSPMSVRRGMAGQADPPLPVESRRDGPTLERVRRLRDE